MGLFGKAARGLFGGFNDGTFAEAQAYLKGDYAGASEIAAQGEKLRLLRDKDRREQAEIAAVHAQIDQDPSLSPEAKAYAKANPKAYIENYLKRYSPFDNGAAGGSRGMLQADGTYKYEMAPSRHEYQGSVYDVGGGPQGAPMKVTPQHEGTMYVTPQPGTEAFPVNSFTGARVGAQGAPQIAQPKSEEEYNALAPGTEYIAPDGSRKRKGGAGPSVGPATFPRSY
jgi:hypothetical protein